MVSSIRILGPMVLALGLCRLGLVAGAGAAGAPAAPAQKKAPAGLVITAVELRPASTLLEQTCPVVLVFHGDITTNRSAAVTYTWVDSHGHAWPQHHRRFSLPGRNGVSHKWKLGKPGKTVDAWVQLQVISPEARSSGKVPVHFTCAK